MIPHLRKQFEALTRQEIWTVWKLLCQARGLPCHTLPFRNGGQFFDELTRAGVYHSEVVSALWMHEKHRPLIAKLLGVDYD
jgi:hypothetical protein